MAGVLRVVLALLICWVQQCTSQDSRLTFNPSQLLLDANTSITGKNLEITCRPPSSNVNALLTLIIRKESPSSPGSLTQLVSAVTGQNEGKAKLPKTQANAEASGGIAKKSITLTLKQAKCEDKAVYFCEAIYLDSSSNSHIPVKNQTLTVAVSPGQLTMKLQSSPSPGNSLWAVNNILTLKCNGPVGTWDATDRSLQAMWVWEYLDSGISWSSYSPSSDIELEINRSSSCQQEQTSVLKHHLTLSDSNRRYRCYVRWKGRDYKEFAANYSVGKVTQDGKPIQEEPSSGPSTASVGAIIGGVFGSLLLIAAILIIIYFLVIRPRRQSKGKEDPAEPEKGVDSDAPPAYMPGDPVTYSQPSRSHHGKDKSEGITNKGMDDADDKLDNKTPPDNDDKRHGRRHKDKKPPEDKRAPLAPHDTEPDPDDYDPNYVRLERSNRDPRHGRHRDTDEKPSHERSRRRDDDRQGNDNHRGRRHRDADDYNNSAAYDGDYGQGRRNRGYENDNRGRGHHSSSEDGGTDSYVNTSQYSIGDGDPTIGTAI